jgi:hypothetical protein
MEQLAAVDVEPGDMESAGSYLASLKSELTEEKGARKKLKSK